MAAGVIGLPVDELHDRALLNHLSKFQLVMRTRPCGSGAPCKR
jgi:hypothetical protein